jgi:hypothetical protein
MDIKELHKRLVEARDAIIRDRPKETLRISLNLLDLVRTRIQTSGTNSKNVQFTPYSASYAKQRVKAGYQAGYVDFTRTGRLWANIAPFVVDNTREVTIVEISARNPDLQSILNYQSVLPGKKPRGNILTPTEKELAFLEAAHLARLRKHLEKVFEQ